MNKNILKIAIVGLVFSMSVSAKASPLEERTIIAMSSCSKNKSCPDQDDTNSGCNNCQSKREKKYPSLKDRSKTAATKTVRKSAARKVIEGS